MSVKKNRPESEISQRIDVVRASRATTFRALLKEGKFDVESDLRYQNLSSLSFVGEDLRGIDFTGANLEGCDFKNALIDGARFERARLGTVSKSGMQYADIEQASDWADFAMSWKHLHREITLDECGDDHLPVGTIFHDAPFLPRMVVLPQLSQSDKFGLVRVAVSLDTVSSSAFHFHKLSQLRDVNKMRSELENLHKSQGRAQSRADVTDGETFALWASQSVARRYRPLFQPNRENESDLARHIPLTDAWDSYKWEPSPKRGAGNFEPKGLSFLEQFVEAQLPWFFDDWTLEDGVEREDPRK